MGLGEREREWLFLFSHPTTTARLRLLASKTFYENPFSRLHATSNESDWCLAGARSPRDEETTSLRERPITDSPMSTPPVLYRETRDASLGCTNTTLHANQLFSAVAANGLFSPRVRRFRPPAWAVSRTRCATTAALPFGEGRKEPLLSAQAREIGRRAKRERSYYLPFPPLHKQDTSMSERVRSRNGTLE